MSNHRSNDDTFQPIPHDEDELLEELDFPLGLTSSHSIPTVSSTPQISGNTPEVSESGYLSSYSDSGPLMGSSRVTPDTSGFSGAASPRDETEQELFELNLDDRIPIASGRSDIPSPQLSRNRLYQQMHSCPTNGFNVPRPIVAPLAIRPRPPVGAAMSAFRPLGNQIIRPSSAPISDVCYEIAEEREIDYDITEVDTPVPGLNPQENPLLGPYLDSIPDSDVDALGHATSAEIPIPHSNLSPPHRCQSVPVISHDEKIEIVGRTLAEMGDDLSSNSSSMRSFVELFYLSKSCPTDSQQGAADERQRRFSYLPVSSSFEPNREQQPRRRSVTATMMQTLNNAGRACAQLVGAYVGDCDDDILPTEDIPTEDVFDVPGQNDNDEDGNIL